MTGITYRDAYKLLILHIMNVHAAYNMIFIFKKLYIETEFLRTSILFLILSQGSPNHNKKGTTLVIYSLSFHFDT